MLPPPIAASVASGEVGVWVEGVVLLGVRVSAHAVIDFTEHQRRVAAEVAAVTDPALLERLLDLDGAGGTLKPPLSIEDVVVSAAVGGELTAVQDASLFAGFTRRWIATARSSVPVAAQLEAKICGVGIFGAEGQVLLPAETPASVTVDKWSWLLQEKVYRRWLSEPSQEHATGNQLLSTGEASSTRGS